METKYGFTLLEKNEISDWVKNLEVYRDIRFIQEHHTWIPSYDHFKGNNHFDLQKGMKHTHVVDNGWNDIGQHFTIFPDGKVCTGRSLELNPACISQNNRSAICIENLGDFDTGKDVMTNEQKESIILLTSSLAKRFGIPLNTDRIVYHHWFRLGTGERNNGGPTTTNKTCPGTNFFGGNSVADANANFIPLLSAPNNPNVVPSKLLFYGIVDVNTELNVRKQANSRSEKVGKLSKGTVVRVYEEKNNWYRISQSSQEWVYANYIDKLRLAKVNVATNLNVRSGPGTNYAKVASLPKNYDVYVHETSNGWAKIDVGNQWVSESFLNYITDLP